MATNDRTLVRTKWRISIVTFALTAACGGVYEAEGEGSAITYGDEPQEALAQPQEAALVELTEEEVMDDPNHSQEELDEYDALRSEAGPILEEKIGGSCGSRNGFWDQVITSFVPPDHFPPDSIAGLPIAAVTGICAVAGVAHFHKAGCNAHDECYATPGRSKASCDLEFRRNLRDECNDTYDSIFSRGCRAACRAVVDVIYGAVAAYGNDAYEYAQQHPIAGSAPPRVPDPACVASCQENCTYLQYDQIGICQYGCPDACR